METGAETGAAGAIEREGLTLNEAAQFLGIGRDTFYTSGLADRLPHVRAGRRRLYHKTALREWFATEARKAGKPIAD